MTDPDQAVWLASDGSVRSRAALQRVTGLQPMFALHVAGGFGRDVSTALPQLVPVRGCSHSFFCASVQELLDVGKAECCSQRGPISLAITIDSSLKTLHQSGEKEGFLPLGRLTKSAFGRTNLAAISFATLSGRGHLETPQCCPHVGAWHFTRVRSR